MNEQIVTQSLKGKEGQAWKEEVNWLVKPLLKETLKNTSHEIVFNQESKQIDISWLNGPRTEAVEAMVLAVLGPRPHKKETNSMVVLSYESVEVFLKRETSNYLKALVMVFLYTQRGCSLCKENEKNYNGPSFSTMLKNAGDDLLLKIELSQKTGTAKALPIVQNTLPARTDSLLKVKKEEKVKHLQEDFAKVAALLVNPFLPKTLEAAEEVLAARLCVNGHLKGLQKLQQKNGPCKLPA